jgi:hypothetical protein
MKYKTVSKLTKASYAKNREIPDDIDGWELDRNLSTSENKVFHNPDSGKTTMVSRGTQGLADWGNNAAYVTKQYKNTKRFQHAKKINERAQDAYGQVDSYLGHSQGSVISRKLSRKNEESKAILINPASLGKKENKRTTTIKSSRDPVSILHKNDKNTHVIKAESLNPFTEHSSAILERDGEQFIGAGFHFHVFP